MIIMLILFAVFAGASVISISKEGLSLHALVAIFLLSISFFDLGYHTFVGRPASKTMMEQNAIYEVLFHYTQNGDFILVKNKRENIELYGPINPNEIQAGSDSKFVKIVQKNGKKIILPFPTNP